ncbi:hypothetical protein A33M_1929 [Rhodovulum sp. PH10]|nr:hypothetical protein A33M_1929 [Rhodovulum sp. PH10]
MKNGCARARIRKTTRGSCSRLPCGLCSAIIRRSKAAGDRVADTGREA